MQYRWLRFPEGKVKAVTFSYDDGPRYDIKLVDIMNKNGIKGTFNINAAYMAKSESDWYLRPVDIKNYILDNGHEIAIHGDRHRAPGLSSLTMAIEDCLYCRRKLEETFGIIVKGMAYPDSGIRTFENGENYNDVKTYLKSLGISYARTLGGDNDIFAIPNDFYAWMPTAYHRNPSVLETIQKFNNIDSSKYQDRNPYLFYLWGHSYEFNTHNNWDLFEKICENLGNKDDVWYATNMEIYNYISGYRNLVFSADEKTVYNPNLFEIWFDVDNNLFSIKPGETLVIDKLNNEN